LPWPHHLRPEAVAVDSGQFPEKPPHRRSNQPRLSKIWQAQKERDATLEVLHFLAEVSRRKLYLEEGQTSLWGYCRKFLKMSEGSTSRRTAAMKLLCELPEIEDQVESGELNLTTLSKAATFFSQEEKVSAPIAPEEKLDVLKELENKSSSETENELQRRSTAPKPKGKDQARKLTDELNPSVARGRPRASGGAGADPGASRSPPSQAELERTCAGDGPQVSRLSKEITLPDIHSNHVS
jgi:hypothetical protein